MSEEIILVLQIETKRITIKYLIIPKFNSDVPALWAGKRSKKYLKRNRYL